MAGHSVQQSQGGLGSQAAEHRRQLHPLLGRAGNAEMACFVCSEQRTLSLELRRAGWPFPRKGGSLLSPPPPPCPLCESSAPCMDKQKQAQALVSRFRGSGVEWKGLSVLVCTAGSGCPLFTLGPTRPQTRHSLTVRSEWFPELHQCRHACRSLRACPASKQGSAGSVSVCACGSGEEGSGPAPASGQAPRRLQILD